MEKRIHIQQISIVSLKAWHLPVAWKIEIEEGDISKSGNEVKINFLDVLRSKHQHVSAIVGIGLDGSVVTFDVALDNTPFDGKSKNSRMRMYTTIPLPEGFMDD